MRLGAAIGAVGFAVPESVHARQEYYDRIAEATGTCEDCSLCHTGSVGAAGTWDPVERPFLGAWLSGGLEPHLPAETSDADLDGFSDLQELREFGDPNDPAVVPGTFTCPGAEYGCSRIARSAPAPDLVWLSATLLLGIVLVRRRD